MIFACKACRAKEAHIETLLAQVALLRSLLPPQTSASNIPETAREADRLLSGEGPDTVALSEAAKKHMEDVQSEAIRLLTATY